MNSSFTPDPKNHVWLVVNPKSGSHDAQAVDGLIVAFARGGHPVTRIIACPSDPLPDLSELEAAGIGTLAVFAGDGTINAAVKKTSGWDGALLVLPGGTMNLLAGRLHGELAAPDIVERVCKGQAERIRVPAISCGDGDMPCSLVGIIAGPSTAWREIRENMRHIDFSGLTEQLPAVFEKSMGGNTVHLVGQDRGYPGLFVEPGPGGMRITGFRLDGAIDIFRHGFAWLGKDFRDGPHDDLGVHEDARIAHSNGDSDDDIGLLIDGEDGSAAAPLLLTQSEVDLDFLRAS